MVRAHASLLALVVTSAAFAQTDDEKNTAREFGNEGQAALERGDAKTAEDRYHRAVLIFDNAKATVPPTLLLGYARGASRNNHFIEAEEAYNRILRAGLPPNAPAPFVKAFEDAKREIDGVLPHIGHVTITVSGCDAPSVLLDGTQLPTVVLGVKKPINPGNHELKASAAGCKAGTTTFSVGEGAETNASLALEKDATAPPPENPPVTQPVTNPPPTHETTTASNDGLRTAGWVTLGIGGAGLVLGAIFAGVAAGTHGDLANKCASGVCPSNDQSEVDSYHLQGTLATVGLIAGPVLLATGLVMVLVAPSGHKREASVTPFVGPGSAGLFGRF